MRLSWARRRPRPSGESVGCGYPPSFQGWRLKARDRNWDRGGGRVLRRTDKGRGRGSGSACERQTDGGGERRGEPETEKWREANRKTQETQQREGETYTGTEREREEKRDWVRRGEEVMRQTEKT